MTNDQHNRNLSHGDQYDHRGSWSCAVFVVAILVRLLNLICLGQSKFFGFKIGDAARYDAWAHRIAEGDWIGQGVFYQAPLYPYFLGTVYTFFGDDLMTLRKVQAFMASIACVFLMNAVWNFLGKRSAIVGGFVMALYAPSIFLETQIQKSILDLFFISVLIWLISQITVHQRWSICKSRVAPQNIYWPSWLWLGVIAGGLCLTRENALVFIPVLFLFGLQKPIVAWLANRYAQFADRFELGKQYYLKQTAIACGMITLGLLLTLGPVTLRNGIVGGEYHLTTSQLGPNLYIGNNPNADGTYQPIKFGRGDAQYEQLDAVAFAEENMGRTLTPQEVSDYYVGEVLTFVKESPVEWLGLMWRKVLLTVNSVESIDTEDQYTYEESSLPLFLLGRVFTFGFLFPLGIIGIWQTRGKLKELWPLYSFTLLLVATLIMFFVFGRYRFPLVPFLIFFAAPVLARLSEKLQTWTSWSRLSEKQKFKLWAKGLGIAALFWVCHLNVVSIDAQRAVTLGNFGNCHLICGDFDEAEACFEKSLELEPNNPLVCNSLGVLHREKDHPTRALYYFQKSLNSAPQYDSARNNMHRLITKCRNLELSE